MTTESLSNTANPSNPLPDLSKNKAERPPIAVTKPISYTFDLGNLLIHDCNPLPPSPSEIQLKDCARDCAQALINQLLTTCPIEKSSDDKGIMMTLPPPTFPLPREKPLPKPKQPTKWDLFAKKKGIKPSREGTGKMVFDEEKGEWVPKWGYKGKNKEGEGEWIVEVDEKKEKAREEAAAAGGKGKGKAKGSGAPATERSEMRRERVEKIKRNERRQRANERRSRKATAAAG